jgi:hypothetical protein
MDVNVSDLHAVEDTIEYLEINPNPTYDDLVKRLSWYWERDEDLSFTGNRKPKSWILDWIKALSS